MGFGTRDISPAAQRNKVMDLEIKKRIEKEKRMTVGMNFASLSSGLADECLNMGVARCPD